MSSRIGTGAPIAHLAASPRSTVNHTTANFTTQVSQNIAGSVLEAHPETRNHRAIVLIAEALHETFDCPGD